MLVSLGIAAVIAAIMVWLGGDMLERERAADRARLQDQLDYTAERVAGALTRQLTAAEEQLAHVLSRAEQPSAYRPRSLLLVFEGARLTSFPGDRLLYFPEVAPPAEPFEHAFTEAERLEFQQQAYGAAAAALRRLSTSGPPLTRAAALLRLGRVLRKAGQPEAAIGAYRALQQWQEVAVSGLPAELVARDAICALFAESNRKSDLAAEATAFREALHGGRWRLTRGAYLYYVQRIGRWLGDTPSDAPVRERLAFSAAAQKARELHEAARRGYTRPSGRETFWAEEQPMLLLWQTSGERMGVLIFAEGAFLEDWLWGLDGVDRNIVRLQLLDGENRAVLGGEAPLAQPYAVRPAAQTRLPWTLYVAAQSHTTSPDLRARERLVLAAMGVLTLLVLAGGYFIGRTVSRELEVARLQADFVAAVSHDFRTPLASLRQLTELLADGRVPDESLRQQYYGRLLAETQRLQHLVEGLLDLSRMQPGSLYRLEPVPAAELVRDVAREFGDSVHDRGYQVAVNLAGDARLRADRDALSRALWNVLDNAVKYSPDCRTVWIDAGAENGHYVIAVRDRGVGIPPDEQPRIFERFVRASSGRAAGVKGSGLGLAMVRQIVEGHRGQVQVESQTGQGSSFRILLPISKEL